MYIFKIVKIRIFFTIVPTHAGKQVGECQKLVGSVIILFHSQISEVLLLLNMVY